MQPMRCRECHKETSRAVYINGDGPYCAFCDPRLSNEAYDGALLRRVREFENEVGRLRAQQGT